MPITYYDTVNLFSCRQKYGHSKTIIPKWRFEKQKFLTQLCNTGIRALFSKDSYSDAINYEFDSYENNFINDIDKLNEALNIKNKAIAIIDDYNQEDNLFINNSSFGFKVGSDYTYKYKGYDFTGYDFTVRPHVMYKDLADNNIVIENSFSNIFIPYDDLMFSLKDLYTAYILHKNNINISCIVHNQIKSRPCEPVPVLKSGALSKALSVKTTMERYIKQLQDKNLNIEDYTDVIARLATHPFCDKKIIPIDIHNAINIVEGYLDGFIYYSNGPTFMEPGVRKCSFCDYKLNCYPDLQQATNNINDTEWDD